MHEPRTEPAPHVVQREAPRIPRLLDASSEEPQRIHVEEDVQEVAVDEHVRQHGPRLLGEIAHVEPESGLDIGAIDHRHLKEIDDDIHRDEPPHCGGHPRWLEIIRDGERHAGCSSRYSCY
jgi:hypothetical protein